jgi:hypothetical protein
LWNGAPYDRLKTSYGLPRGAITVGTTPTGNANPVVNRTVGITMSATARSMAKSLPVVLEPLSQQYRKLVIGGSNIRTLTFRSPPITTHFTNSAILTTPGRAPATIAWRPPTTSQYICLDTQPVTEAILMFSAGSVTQGGSGNAWVHASNSCAAPSSLTWDSDPNVTGGGTVSGTVTINRPAPASGVELVVDAPSTVIVPAKIVVPAGQTRASFTVTTVPVDADTFPTVTISRAKELAIPGMAHGALRIRPATLKTLALPGRAQAGTTFAAGVGLNAPAGPGGVLVSLQAAMLTPPSTVNVEAGSNFAQFEVTADDTGCLSACERTGQLIANANGTVLAKTMVVIGPP